VTSEDLALVLGAIATTVTGLGTFVAAVGGAVVMVIRELRRTRAELAVNTAKTIEIAHELNSVAEAARSYRADLENALRAADIVIPADPSLVKGL
jgi:hypothetical protein